MREPDHDYKIWLAVILSLTIIVVSIIAAVTADDLYEMKSGIRPQIIQHYDYEWPKGVN